MTKEDDRRPIWLDREQGWLLITALQHAAADSIGYRAKLYDLIETIEAQGSDPEAWLTVDPLARVVRADERIRDLERLVYTVWCDLLTLTPEQETQLNRIIDSVNPDGRPSTELGIGIPVRGLADR